MPREKPLPASVLVFASGPGSRRMETLCFPFMILCILVLMRADMRRTRLCCAVLLAALFWSINGFAQGSYKVAPVPLPASSDLPKVLSGAVEQQGTSLVDSTGKTLAEVWLSQAIATKQNPESSPDSVYGGIQVGTFVGVLDFPSADTDYRGQKIKPGFYTLRYAQIPQDGNHMGVSPYPDFVLLVPAAQDADPGQVMNYQNLLKLSRMTTTTGHPGVLCMAPVTSAAGSSLPAAVQDDQGDCILEMKGQNKPAAGGAAQDYPIGIILVGQTQS